MSSVDPTRAAALEAIGRGYQVIPIRPNTKRPTMVGWPQITWDPGTTDEQFAARLKEWGFDIDADQPDAYNLGVVLGPTSGGLVDVDIDHPKAKRFRDFLPRTQARSGRPGSPDSHFWYIATGADTPSTRAYRLADGSTVTIEFRYDRGVQTVIPPSDWVPKEWDTTHASNPKLREVRNWSREPWGGAAGPAVVDGRKLALQVALVGLGTVLLDGWPTAGGRHEAYLALAGGLLRMGDGIVHPFWERNASVLIRALANASNDDDGPDAREAESVDSTIRKLRDGKMMWGFPKLADIIGLDQVSMVRTLVAEVESLAGFSSRNATSLPSPTPASTGTATVNPPSTTSNAAAATSDAQAGADDAAVVDEEAGSWGAVDLDPYLSGQLRPVEPTVLVRDDGNALFYPGRLNMLFAPSESGKTLICLYTSLERIAAGERVVYLDFEDEPGNTIERLRTMGASDDDLRLQFTYIRPDEPIATMQRDHWGGHKATAIGEANATLFAHTLEQIDPTLIIADGMTSIYGLHGLDSNNSVETDVITSWLKSLSRNGRTTVVIIDHMAKSAEKGSMPIGSQHKVSMVQGTLLQVWPVRQPILGSVGEVELIVLKDRPGQVRKNAGKLVGRSQVAAKVTIDSTVPGVTKFTIGTPPNAGQPQAPAAAPSTPTATKVDRDAARAFTKLQRTKDEDALFLSPFKGIAGTRLSGKEILTAIGADWVAKGWTNTSLNITRDRLVQTGWLLKTGGERGPKVAYTLQTGTVAPPDAATQAATPSPAP